MGETLLQKRSELHSEYKVLLNRLSKINQEKNQELLKKQNELEKKSKFYKTFRKGKYLTELEQVKTAIELNKIYFHDFDEVKKIKTRILKINEELNDIDNQLVQMNPSKRM